MPPDAVKLVEMLNVLLQLSLNQHSMRNDEYAARVSGSLQQIRSHLMRAMEPPSPASPIRSEFAISPVREAEFLVTEERYMSAPMTRAVASLLPHLQRDQDLAVEALRADPPKAVGHIGLALANTTKLLSIVKDMKEGRANCYA